MNDDLNRHRKGHQAFSRGDSETLDRLFADDVVWHVTGKNPIAGDYRGKDAVFSLFQRVREETNGTFHLDDEAFVEGDGEDETFAISHVQAKKADKSLDVRMYEHTRWRDGRVAESRIVFDDPYAADAFWS
jgi:uncharacterized protein